MEEIVSFISNHLLLVGGVVVVAVFVFRFSPVPFFMTFGVWPESQGSVGYELVSQIVRLKLRHFAKEWKDNDDYEKFRLGHPENELYRIPLGHMRSHWKDKFDSALAMAKAWGFADGEKDIHYYSSPVISWQG